VERGLSALEPGSSAAYVAVARIMLDSMEDLLTHMAPHDAVFAADVPNFTDITPRFQISEVVL
jgi:uncharacterized protein (TIGR02118 family)